MSGTKKVTYEQGGVQYELGGGLGSWAKSFNERFVVIGTTRFIKGKLMYLYSIHSGCSLQRKKAEFNWVPVDEVKDYSELKTWMNN